MNTTTINKEKLQVFKEELKTIAEEIKVTKSIFKKLQRETCVIHHWCGASPEEKIIWDSLWDSHHKLKSLKFQFRHRLIAYSLTKGKDYGEVEKSVRENNGPNWIFIKGLQNELAS